MRYKSVRIPIEAYEKEKLRLEAMNRKLKQLTKQTNKIKMTQYFKLRSSRPIFIYDDELVNYFSNKKKGGKYSIL